MGILKWVVGEIVPENQVGGPGSQFRSVQVVCQFALGVISLIGGCIHVYSYRIDAYG
jgi:hypothetical protein